MRRFGEAYRADKRYTARPGAYALLLREGKALLTLQTDEHSTELQFPGGGIDPGESPMQALHRECLEETGWRIGNLRRLTAYRRFVFMPEYDLWAEKICHIYLGRPVQRLCAPSEAGHEALWVPLEEARTELDSAGDRAVVDAFLGGSPCWRK